MGLLKTRFMLNNTLVEIDVEPNEILLDTLRNKLGIKSVKRGCERGECGVCTVLVDNKPVYSCMILTITLENHVVTTIEGLVGDPLFNKLVSSFVEKGAIQCGFCTPGFLLTAYALYKSGEKPSREDVLKAIEGNLCRCTGYKKIVEAIEHVMNTT